MSGPAIMLNPSGACGCSPDCGSCCVTCAPCPIPKADLTLSWSNSLYGDGSVTLAYNGSTWASGCVNQLQFVLSCAGGQITLTVTYYLSGTCPTGQAQNCVSPGSDPFAITLASFTCNPFQLSYTVTGAGCPVLWSNGYSALTITGPPVSPYGYSGICCQTFQVIGCNSLALPGATVSVFDSNGGNLLASEVTPASGSVTLWWYAGSSPCNVYVTVTEPSGRFVAYGQSLMLTAAGSSTITLAPAAGYYCGFGCLYPVAATLHLTDSFFGSFTVVNSGAGWVYPTISYSYPGCGGCPAKTVTVNFSALEWHWTTTFGGCPDDAFFYLCNTVLTPTIESCFVPGVSAFGISGTWPAGYIAGVTGTCVAQFTCLSGPSPQTTTLTE